MKERDVLRRQIINYFRHHTTDQTWYRPGLESYEKQFVRFFMCDTTKDNFVDANELAACVTNVPLALRSTTATNELVGFFRTKTWPLLSPHWPNDSVKMAAD